MITKWLVEYSVQQGCFHVDTAQRCCEFNIHALSRGYIPQFSPIAAFDSREEALNFAREFYEEMREKKND